MDDAERAGDESLLESTAFRSARLGGPRVEPALADPDARLVELMAKSDEQALRRLFSLYGQRLFAYAFRITGSQTTAEEVVQDSLLAAWRGAKGFRGESRVITWLLGIVFRQSQTAIRRKRVAAVPLDAAVAADLAARDLRPDEVAIELERRRAVLGSLASLSPDHRQVLELVFYHGLSLAEVAEVVGCPVGTVKSRLSYAKAQLRSTLGRAGHRQEDLR